jgi:hypothetical protein
MWTKTAWNSGATSTDPVTGSRRSRSCSCSRHPEICGGLRKQFQQPFPPEPSWALPHIDVIERIVLGGMARGTMRLAEHIRSVAIKDRSLKLTIDEVEKAASSGAEKALARFSEEVTASAHEVAELFASVQR